MSSLVLVLVCTVAALAAAQQTRNGAWVDEVIITEEPSDAAAITRLESGELDIYAYTVTKAELFQRVQNSDALAYKNSFGSYDELTFNPAGPILNNGTLNPFASPRLREAMNWLVDRQYIVQEIYSGLAVAKLFPINSAFPDYARLADVARSLELRYAHNPELASEVIAEEMQALGATLQDGKWHYKGQPVTLIFLIRVEDARREIGDYVATLLEEVGFTVDRQYKTAAEASPLWAQSNPADGLWHVYTGGWVTTEVARDESDNVDFYYTPRGLTFPLWQAYKPLPELDAVALKLANSEFSTLEERRELFAQGLEWALKDSVRVWAVDRLSFIPHRSEVSITSDLAGGVAGSYLWAHTLRLGERAGGTSRIAMPSILVEPWNPVAGTNWVYDSMIMRGTSDPGLMPDPYTGLSWPHRAERAEVTVKEGLPVGKTLDWVDLNFAPEIRVPADAWIDWDAEAQRFVTVGERHPDGLTADRKSVVYYPEDLFDTVKWHDGSPLSIGDFVMGMIFLFDQAKEASAIFDEAQVPAFEAFQAHFRGMRIVSQDPLVIEYYSNQYALDAEDNVVDFWPNYGPVPSSAPWHAIALGVRAEANEELAFSEDKADKLQVEWMNFIAGPSLEILSRHLAEAQAEAYVPYEPTLGRYVSDAEARARWSNYDRWYDEKGHFWVGSGPLYLERAYPVEGQVHVRRFEDYPDPAGTWDRFAEPMIAEAAVSGPRRVAAGSEATFEVSVTFAGEPYPSDLIQEVRYLLFNSSGELASQGAAVSAGEGAYRVTLSADQTRALTVGTSRLEVIVLSKAVSIPTFASAQFISSN